MEDTTEGKWQQELDNKKLKLQECQKSKNLNSCFDCEKLLDCVIRDEYIQAVYDSMSKGEAGGFEF